MRAEQLRGVASALQAVVLATRVEPGCVDCSLSTEVGRRATVLFVEAWESEESLKRHVRSDRFVTLAGLLESATEPPRVEFTLGGITRGLDYANEVRHEATT